MTTEVLRNMIYGRSPALDGLGGRRARRGALPPGHLPRAGVGGGHHPPARRRGARVPVGHGVERRGAGRLDLDRSGADRGGDRGAAPGRAREPLPGRRPARPSGCTCCRRWSTAGPTRRPTASTTRRVRGVRGPRRTRPAASSTRRAGSRWSSGSRKRRCCRRSLHLQPQRLRRGRPVRPRRRPPAHHRRRAGPDPGDRRRATSPRSTTATSTCSATAGSWPGSRPASPPTTPGWSRRSRRRSRPASSKAS